MRPIFSIIDSSILFCSNVYMHKESTKRAIDNYLKKQIKKSSAPKRKNLKPEKEVEKAILQCLDNLGVFASVVESKAVFSKAAGRYLSGQTEAGFPDLVGLNNQGVLVAIELKAPGRRSTVRPAQHEYLMRVISLNGFACVTDSVSHFSQIYSAWLNAPAIDRKSILIRDMPRPKALQVIDGLGLED